MIPVILPRKKLLFVDDEELVLRGMERILRPLQPQWNMMFVQSGDEALQVIEREGGVDAIVSDMRMPGMNGADLLNQVMRAHPHTVRIALSGYADRDIILRCLTAAHQYLAKPCDAETLRLVITRLFECVHTDQHEQLRGLLARCPVLPSVPDVYSRLVAVLNEPSCTLGEVGAIMSQDAAMTTLLLKLVNSAFFGLGRKMTEPMEAAQYLGVDTIKSVVLGTHLFHTPAPTCAEGFSTPQLWSHSIRCAEIARDLALRIEANSPAASEAYVAGLLHDIGKLLLAANLPQDYAAALRLAREEKLPMWEAERRIFGANHAELGGYYLGLLGLPASVVDAVTWHHAPAAAPDQSSLALTALHIGNSFAGHEKSSNAGVAAGTFDLGFIVDRGLYSEFSQWRLERYGLTTGEVEP